ncbi:hypothetical protein [Streptomyces rubiginosohelvolus]|uniref:hypothetical protein n=1 Tax=Streptomyces rubiginosohelvolus TaxID=67362 RepID=UPI0035D5738A
MLAAARQAVLVATVPLPYQPLRQALDERTNVEARMCFYLSGLLTAAEVIQHHLDAGVPVVVESYFARCLTTHRALGARLGITLPSWLPTPATYHLVCDDDERQRRLAGRSKPGLTDRDRYGPGDGRLRLVPDASRRHHGAHSRRGPPGDHEY